MKRLARLVQQPTRQNKNANRVVRATAHAKINLYLRVGARRPDDLHEVTTLMQSISLSDDLRFERGPRSVEYQWAPGLGGPLPGKDDLVGQALEMAGREAARALSTRVQVTKSIPLGGGLGGGSADAAAALLALMQLHDFSFGENLARVCRQLGADVGFCLKGGAAIGRGVGDELTPAPCPKTLWWVLGIPDFSISTHEVYQRFDELPSPSGPATIEELAGALEKGALASIAGGLHNDLEGAAFVIAPRLASLKQAMIEAGPLGVVMTGSGATIAALCASESDARFVAKAAQPSFGRTEIVSSCSAGVELSSEKLVETGAAE